MTSHLTSNQSEFENRGLIEPKIILKLRGEGPFHREDFENLPAVVKHAGKVDQFIDQACAQVSLGFGQQHFDEVAFLDQTAWLKEVAPATLQAIEELRKDTDRVAHVYSDPIISLDLKRARLPKCFHDFRDFEQLPNLWNFDLKNLSVNDRDLPKQWGLFAIHAVDAWPQALQQGQGIPVAVVDTGITAGSADLARLVVNNRVQGKNFTQEKDEDQHGHGTHVAGIVGATGNNGFLVAGVAWQADLFSYKILDKNGLGHASQAARAVQAATEDGARILLASWGVLEPVPCLEDALKEAQKAGVLVIAAAGNVGPDPADFYPAKYAEKFDNILAVGSTTWNCDAKTEGPAENSNRGNWIEIGAPGVHIISDWPDGSIYDLSGTSMAAAFVAGAAALVLGQFPSLDYRGLKNRLLAGVDKIDALKGAWQDGRRLNVLKSLQ